jgi:hypothetical protein
LHLRLHASHGGHLGLLQKALLLLCLWLQQQRLAGAGRDSRSRHADACHACGPDDTLLLQGQGGLLWHLLQNDTTWAHCRHLLQHHLLLQLWAGWHGLALLHDRACLALLLLRHHHHRLHCWGALLLTAKHDLLGLLLHHYQVPLLLLLLQDVLDAHRVLQLHHLLHALWPKGLLKQRGSGANCRHVHSPLTWLPCQHVGLLQLHALRIAHHTWPHCLRLLGQTLHHLHGCWLACNGDWSVLSALRDLGQQLVQGLEAADGDRFQCLDGCRLCHATHKQVLG